ncbi:FtsQ-type POTRA domain-containing protein [Microbacterium sp. C7(2022)]|uniref:FtsQ-type POTRA domain-containing protein n=1 Tax=Microbacterium sp. C7(2022) TaxID=2992759 RepID=UPI00237A73BD|nr:FtsQ-type POTRA domain-containing protein [Microbacterium sp. C7(2022)]
MPGDAAPAGAADETATTRPGDDAVRMRDVWSASRARRKALRAEVRRFTGRQRRRRMVWIGSASAVVLLVLATLGAAYSPLLAVRDITVVGAERLDAEEIEQALAGEVGTPLPLVDESAVKSALVSFPLIESYTLEARPPHELVVKLVERTPVGVVETAAGFTLVDAAGVALATTEEREGDEPLVTASGGIGSDAFAAIGLVMRTLPESIRARVTEVSATSPNDVTLRFGDTRTDVVWGSAEDSALKALNLETIMESRAPEDVSVYDVSSPTVVVVR